MAKAKKKVGKGKDVVKATKKTEKSVVAPAPTDDEIENSLEKLSLTREEMMELELHENRVQMQVYVREKFEMKEQILQRAYTDSRDVMRKKQAEAVASMEEAKRDYNALVARIQEKLGIKLGDYAIRDDGVLMLANESGAGKTPPK